VYARKAVMKIQHFYDPVTFTNTFVAFDPETKDAVVIDPVLDYDLLSSSTATKSVEAVAAFLREQSLRVHYALETHPHADHLSAGQWLKKRFDAKVAIGAGVKLVQATFKDVYDASFATDGSQFDVLLDDGQVLKAGSLEIKVIATPGHTPACVSYLVGDAVFTGDSLFMEDYGVGRCDFPRGSAEELYDSVHRKLYGLPDATRVFVGHDYQPGGRDVKWETTIGRSKASNVQLNAKTTRDEFVKVRNERDATLQSPRLLWASIQVNIVAGKLPAPHANGNRYLTVPLNLRAPTDDDGTPSAR
jgi:glyoxylase-like metal-dependent hydrolase (beta-lactamase superfamily II)